MGNLTFTLLFVMAISIDSFGIGCVLGLKKISMTFGRIVLVSIMTGVCFLLASNLSLYALPFLAENDADKLGAFLLIVLGMLFLWQYFRKGRKRADRAWLKPGQVLSDPESADIDRSGGIKGKEVWLLGAALSLDTAGAGLSGVLTATPWAAAYIAGATCIMLYAGLQSGEKLSDRAGNFSVLSGVLLIVLGLIKLV